MANTIRIKRRNSGGTGAPTTLQSGELAFNDVNNTLYIGRGDNGSGVATSIPAIAGDGSFVSLAGTQTISGAKTFSGTVNLGSSATATTPGTGSNDTTVATTAFVVSKTTGFGTGTVTSVGLSLPSFITVTGSPVTTSGTLTGTLAAQSANQIFAGPSIGSSAAPTFRTLVADDVPSINFLNIGGNLSLSSFRITNLSEPINASDAATKNYVDATAQGIHTHTSCRMATAAALPTCTYANGSSGVGATLTATANGALSVDGITVATNDRILVKNQASALQNGIYVVTNTGSAGAPFVLTRATDMDQAAEFPASFEFVEEGSTNADSGWICTTNEPITVGTTPIDFTQFSGAGQITAGNGLTKTGNTLSVLSANAARIAVSGSGVDLATVTTTTPTGSAGTSFVSAVATDGYGRVTSVTTSPAVVASTSAAGIVQLSDATNSTAVDRAATANAVKVTKDVADGALSRSSGGTMSGKITMKASDTTAPYNIPQGTQDPTSPVTGDFWNNGGNLFLRDASKNNRILWADLGNLTATVSPAQGGTGATSFTAGALLKGNGTSAILTATAGTDFVKAGTLTVGEVFFAASTASDASFNIATGIDPTSPVAGDVWSTGTAVKFRNSVSSTKTFAFLDSNITGTAAGLSATLAVGFGGTGATTLTGYVKGNGTSAMTAAATIPNTDITGLGTMSTQAASNVSITGGTIDGIVLDGGTF
jgi:hypothetical protein